MANLAFFAVVFGLLVAAYRRPGLACGYVFASYSLEQCAQSFVPIAGYNETLCNYLIAVSVVVALVGKVVRTGTSTFRVGAPTLAVIALVLYCYASVLWSLFPSTTLRVLNASLPYLGVFVILGPLLVGSTEDAADALHSMLWCSAVTLGALLLFAEWGRRGVILPFRDWESNPLAVTRDAGALLIAVVLVPSIKRLNPTLKVAVIASALAIVLFAFLRSASRGQIVASIIATIAFSALGKRAWWFPLLLVAVLGLLSIGFLEDEVARNSVRWEADHVEHAIKDERLGRGGLLLQYWSESSPVHLIFGLGHATSRDPRVIGGYPHFVPAEVLAEEGLVGAVLYLIVLIVAATYMLRAYRASSGDRRAWVIAVGALLFYEFQLTFKQGTLLAASSFLLLLVLSGSLSRFPARAPTIRTSQASYRPLANHPA